MTIKRLTITRFLAAIEGSKGIKSVVCQRLPCHALTFERWIAKHVAVKEAFDTECNRMLGIAHSVVTGNIELALAEQEETGAQVDSSDAKWYLSKKGKDQGFGTAPGVSVQVGVTLVNWRKQAETRRKQVEDL